MEQYDDKLPDFLNCRLKLGVFLVASPFLAVPALLLFKLCWRLAAERAFTAGAAGLLLVPVRLAEWLR